MFDQNLPHAFDKIVVKHFSEIWPQNLTLTPNIKVVENSKENNLWNKKHATLKKVYRPNAHLLDMPNALINILYYLIIIIVINKVIYNFNYLKNSVN